VWESLGQGQGCRLTCGYADNMGVSGVGKVGGPGWDFSRHNFQYPYFLRNKLIL
jgi:hypothetical protein